MTRCLDPAALRTLELIEMGEGTRDSRGYPAAVTPDPAVIGDQFVGEILPVESRVAETFTGPMAEATHWCVPSDPVAAMQGTGFRREKHALRDAVTLEIWEIAAVFDWPGQSVMEIGLIQHAPAAP